MDGSRRQPAAAWRVVALVSCLIGLACLPARGEEPVADWTIDSSRWQGALAPSTAIEIRNPYGDVRLRASDAGEVELSAMIQRRTADPVKAEVTVERHGGRLLVEVRYPSAPQGDLRRVDVAVFVPAHTPVAVHTRDGMIQARGLANDLELTSAGGDVFLSTSGTARVDAGRGNITAQLGGGGWSRAPRLSTRDGNITLALPDDADARVSIRAPGKIAVEAQPRLERRYARGAVVTFGRGTGSLSLETRRGGVTLLPANLS